MVAENHLKPSTGKRGLLPNWSLWLLPAFYYCYQYGIQILPSVANQHLATQFNASPLDLSFLSSSYLYIYIFFQIPAGMLYDRFNPRYLLALSLLGFALGTAIFAFTGSLWLGMLGRGLSGLCGSFAFIGALYLASLYVSPRHYTRAVGFTELLSSIAVVGFGLVFGTLFQGGADHWGLVMFTSIGVSIAFAFLMWLLVTDQPPLPHAEQLDLGEFWRRVLCLFREPQLWLNGFYIGCALTNMIVLANMWRVPELMATYHITEIDAVRSNSLFELGFAVGAPLIGWLDGYWRPWRKQVMMIGALIETVSLIWVHYFEPPYSVKLVLLLVIGVTTAIGLLSFAIAKESVAPSLRGFATGFINMFSTLVGVLTLPFVGWLLDKTHNSFYWSATPAVVVTGLTIIVAMLIRDGERQLGV